MAVLKFTYLIQISIINWGKFQLNAFKESLWSLLFILCAGKFIPWDKKGIEQSSFLLWWLSEDVHSRLLMHKMALVFFLSSLRLVWKQRWEKKRKLTIFPISSKMTVEASIDIFFHLLDKEMLPGRLSLFYGGKRKKMRWMCWILSHQITKKLRMWSCQSTITTNKQIVNLFCNIYKSMFS